MEHAQVRHWFDRYVVPLQKEQLDKAPRIQTSMPEYTDVCGRKLDEWRTPAFPQYVLGRAGAFSRRERFPRKSFIMYSRIRP
jgi:hypothetical protein